MVMILLKRGIYLLCMMTITIVFSTGLRSCLQPDEYRLVFDERLSAEGRKLIEQAFACYADSAVNKAGVTAAGFLDCVRHYLPHVESVSIRTYPSAQATVSVHTADPFIAIAVEGQIRHLYMNGILAESDMLASRYARSLPVVLCVRSNQADAFGTTIVSDLMKLQHIIVLLADGSACVCRGVHWLSSHEIACTVVNEAIGKPLTILLDSDYPRCQASVRKAVELYTKGTVPAPCKADVRFDGQIVFMKGGMWDEEM